MKKTNRFSRAKKRAKSLSPCMYPIEYRWIRAATPVMKRAMVTDSGSTRKPTSTVSPPTGNHSKSTWEKTRSSPGRSTRPMKTAIVAAKEPPSTAVANQPAAGSPSRRPARVSTTKPARGRAGINQTSSSMP